MSIPAVPGALVPEPTTSTATSRPWKTRAQALADLGRVVADALMISRALSPEDAAKRAWHPGGPPVEELASQIEAARRTLRQN